MIDTDKMRRVLGRQSAFARGDHNGKAYCNPIELCRFCAVDALCDELDRMRADRDSWRRVAERLEREKQEETTGGPEQ